VNKRKGDDGTEKEMVGEGGRTRAAALAYAGGNNDSMVEVGSNGGNSRSET